MTYQEIYSYLELVATDVGMTFMSGNKDQFNKFDGPLPTIYMDPAPSNPTFPNNINIKHDYRIELAFLAATVRDTTSTLARTGVINLMHNKATVFLNKLKFENFEYGDFDYSIENISLVPVYEFNWNSRITGGVVLTFNLLPQSTYDYSNNVVGVSPIGEIQPADSPYDCQFYQDTTYFYHSCNYGLDWRVYRYEIADPNNESQATSEANTGQVGKPTTIGEIQSLTFA